MFILVDTCRAKKIFSLLQILLLAMSVYSTTREKIEQRDLLQWRLLLRIYYLLLWCEDF